jgi:hypothetical protein
VLRLPSGLLVRGRGVRRPATGRAPTFGLYLLMRRPAVDWPARLVRWPDFGLPLRPAELRSALEEVRSRVGTERVEIACGGGNGRTGTALACLAVLDGVRPADAVPYVRAHYARGAVETPWQRQFVVRFRR